MIRTARCDWWRHAVAALAAAGAALLLSSCAGAPRADIAYNPAGFTAPDAPYQTVVAGDYHLGPGDMITIGVLDLPEISGDQMLTAAGNIEVPLVGLIAAQGKTAADLARELEKKLGARYYHDPHVTVAVKQANSQKVTIDGSVNQPGVYTLTSDTNLVQAVSLARGPSDNANLRRVLIFRQINGQLQSAAFDLASVREGTAPNPKVYGNDIIIVDGSRTRKFWGDIIKSIPLLALGTPF